MGIKMDTQSGQNTLRDYSKGQKGRGRDENKTVDCYSRVVKLEV